MIEYTDNTRAFDLLESAELIGVVVPTIRRYLKDGKLHGVKYKAKVYIPEAEIMKLREERSSQ